MSHRVRVLKRAQTDIDEIAIYIARDAPDAAQRMLDRLFDAMDGLAELPRRGALPHDARLRALGYRFLVEGEYLIFYKVLRSEVRVYRVLHGKRIYQALL